MGKPPQRLTVAVAIYSIILPSCQNACPSLADNEPYYQVINLIPLALLHFLGREKFTTNILVFFIPFLKR